MPAERVSMRKIREVLRLTHALGMSRRLVGEATGVGKTAVGEYVRRAAVVGSHLADPGRDRRCRAGAAAVSAGGLRRRARRAADAGLVAHP